MELGSVAQLWRYPVKSMMGEMLDEVDCDQLGLTGDRGWATRDEVRGGIKGAKKLGGLMGLSARYVSPPEDPASLPEVEITFPDGTSVRSDHPEVHTRLSAALDHDVTLWPRRPATDLDHYRMAPMDSDDLLEELRGLFGRQIDEPLPDLSTFPPDIFQYESPLGTYFDAYPLLLVTTTSLRTLQAAAPKSMVDVRRFRPNLLIRPDDALDGYPEQAWVGQRLRVGEAVVEVVNACPRCVMITRGFDDLPQDRPLMRTVVAQADQNLGVYARVVEPGRLERGASVVEA